MTSLSLASFCTKIGSGATPRGGKDVYLADGEVTLIRSQNVYNDRFDRSGLAFILPEHAEQLRNVEVEPGDVLLNITGDSVARVCQVPDDVLPARVNQHVAIIRPNPDLLDARFLRFFLASPQMQTHMLAMASAGATRNALTKGMIEGFKIPNLPMSKQLKISALLGSLEDKIELNRRMNETLEGMARALFKDWFVDFGPTRAKMEGREAYLAPDLWHHFPDGLDAEGKPEGWRDVEIGEFLDVRDSQRVPLSSKQRAERQGPYPYYGATSVMDYVNDYLFDDKLLLLGEDGSVVREDGTPFTQYVWGKIWVNNHAHVIKGRGISTEQLKCFFDQKNIAPFVTGAVQAKLNQGNLKRIPFVTAHKAVHTAFDKIIDPWFSLVRKNTDEARTLTQTRDLLLPKLMSGEIRLRDAEKQVEAVA